MGRLGQEEYQAAISVVKSVHLHGVFICHSYDAMTCRARALPSYHKSNANELFRSTSSKESSRVPVAGDCHKGHDPKMTVISAIE